MSCEFEWGDIIQVPRSALSPNLAKCYGDMFGVVISSRQVWDDGRPPHYVVALISKKWESPKLELEISGGSRFAGWAVAPTLIVNVRQCQLNEIPEANRKRDRLSEDDQCDLQCRLVELMLPNDRAEARRRKRRKREGQSWTERFLFWLVLITPLLIFLGAAAGAIAMHFLYPEVVSNLLGCPTPDRPGPY